MWNIIFYQLENGRSPVREFLDSLSRQQHAKAIHEIEILEQFGNSLRMPHAKHIDGKLWELRIKAGSDYLEFSTLFMLVMTSCYFMVSSKKRKRPRPWKSKRQKPTCPTMKGGLTNDL